MFSVGTFTPPNAWDLMDPVLNFLGPQISWAILVSALIGAVLFVYHVIFFRLAQAVAPDVAMQEETALLQTETSWMNAQTAHQKAYDAMPFEEPEEYDEEIGAYLPAGSHER